MFGRKKKKKKEVGEVEEPEIPTPVMETKTMGVEKDESNQLRDELEDELEKDRLKTEEIRRKAEETLVEIDNKKKSLNKPSESQPETKKEVGIPHQVKDVIEEYNDLYSDLAIPNQNKLQFLLLVELMRLRKLIEK